MKYRFKRTPRPYQLIALQKALKLDNAFALWFDPGLGKTKVAIDFMAIKQMKEDLQRILIICPLSAIGVWEDEIPIDHPLSQYMAITPVVGDKEEKLQYLEQTLIHKGEWVQVLIINYDSLIDRGIKTNPIMKLIKEWSPQYLIIDEMHYTKNSNAGRSRAVYKIRKRCRWVMGLTGTPIPKNPLDIFGQYKILDETIFGTRIADFRDMYANMNAKFPGKVNSFKNLGDMAQKIHTIAYRVKDTECKSLPPLIIQDIPVYFTKKSKKIYTQMCDELVAELDNMEVVTAGMAAVKSMKLQQITGGFLMRTDLSIDEKNAVKKTQVTFPVGTEKLDVFMDLVNRYIDDHKLLVGCRFVWETEQIKARLEKRRINYVIIRGGVDADARTEAKRKFQGDPNCKVIIFQVAAATAMTLTAGDIGILYSCTRKWDDYWQWLKRIHREGQTKPVYILRLQVKGTIDRDVYKGLEEKCSYTTSIIDKSEYRQMFKPGF